MKKTPLTLVKERFESKEQLVRAVEKLAKEELWLDRVNSTKGLERVANSKLLRLHDTLSDAKQRFGSRDKLITTILELEKRTKDEGYKARLERYPLPRLLDLHSSAERRAKRVQVKAATDKPKRTSKKSASAS